MARVTYSPLIADARGKIAGTVFSVWKGRAYVRKLIVPNNPQTTAQMAVRDALLPCIKLWRSVGTGIRTWLDKYATPYRMSGYNHYLKINRAKEQADTVHQMTPFNALVDTWTTVTLTPGSSKIGVAVTGGITGPLKYVIAHTRKTAQDFWVEQWAALTSTLPKDITGLTPAVQYEVALVPWDGTLLEAGQAYHEKKTPTA